MHFFNTISKAFPWEKPNAFVLDKDIVWDSGKYHRDKYFISNDNSLTICFGIWRIPSGVKWDGVTYFWDGPEDKNKPGYPVTWFATLIHDLGCKYWNEEYTYFPYNRFQIDWFFFKELRKTTPIFKYFFAYLFYFVVSLYSVFATFLKCDR